MAWVFLCHVRFRGHPSEHPCGVMSSEWIARVMSSSIGESRFESLRAASSSPSLPSPCLLPPCLLTFSLCGRRDHGVAPRAHPSLPTAAPSFARAHVVHIPSKSLFPSRSACLCPQDPSHSLHAARLRDSVLPSPLPPNLGVLCDHLGRRCCRSCQPSFCARSPSPHRDAAASNPLAGRMTSMSA